jgi:multidrug efflux system outer membrane protein
MTFAQSLLCGAAAALVGGCALQPTYHQPAAPVAAAYPSGEAYRQAGGGGAAPATDIGWREFLADPRLQQLVGLALHNNRDLRIAVLNMERARAQYQLQRASLVPQLSAGANAGRQGGPAAVTPGNSYAASLTASWEADFFGRLHNMSDSAAQQYLASAYGRQAAEIMLVANVADQYLTMLAFDEQLVVTQKTLEAAQASYKIIELQFNTGTAPELDLRLAQITVEQALASHAAQVRFRAQAENALVLLVGQSLPAATGPSPRLEQEGILADVPAGLPSELLTRRPDILQAEALLRAEHADIGAARAAFFPQINLTASLGSVSSTLGGLFAAGSGAWAFAPALLAPIFDAGANRARLDMAVLQKDVGVAEYEKAIQTAFREVADGLAARGTYDDQLAALQRDVGAEQRRLELANLRYTNGVDDYLSVLTAQTDLYNAQSALVTARLNRLTSLVDLYRALGGGWRERSAEPRPAPAAA